jgi:hypothetical protein
MAALRSPRIYTTGTIHYGTSLLETLGCPDFGGVGFVDSRCRRRLMPSLELERCEHTQ